MSLPLRIVQPPALGILVASCCAGHIATWNSENPSQVIEVGDRIVSLNDAWRSQMSPTEISTPAATLNVLDI